MTVPAFSPSVVLPGAPSAPAGRGAADTGDGLFATLLAGQTGAATDAQDGSQAEESDARTSTAPQDAGLALLMALPGAAPVLTPTPAGPDDGGEATDLAARQIRVPAFTLAELRSHAASETPLPDELAALLADASATPATTPDVVIPDPATIPPPRIAAPDKSIADRPAQTVPVVDAKATPAVNAAPQPSPAELARGVPPVTPPVETAAATVVAAQAVEVPVQGEAPRPAPTIGDVRRAAVARGDRRAAPAAGPAALALAGESPVKPAALTALDNTVTADAAEGIPAAEPEVVAADAGEASDTSQPALPGEARAASAQIAAAETVVVASRGSPETVAKLAADIIRKLDGQSTRFDLELNPHGMGKVDVAIEIDRAGMLTAAMTFDTAQSAADLRARSAELRQALEQAGFSVSDGGLTFDTAGQNPGFGGRETAQQQQQDRAWHGRAFQRAQSGADAADLAGVSPNPASWTRSGVDIRI